MEVDGEKLEARKDLTNCYRKRICATGWRCGCGLLTQWCIASHQHRLAILGEYQKWNLSQFVAAPLPKNALRVLQSGPRILNRKNSTIKWLQLCMCRNSQAITKVSFPGGVFFSNNWFLATHSKVGLRAFLNLVTEAPSLATAQKQSIK